jgi:hypothetical protein
MVSSGISNPNCGVGSNPVRPLAVPTCRVMRFLGPMLFIVGLCSLHAEQSQTTVGMPAVHTASPRPASTTESEITNIPYFTQSGQFRSVLTLNNNRGADTRAQVIIFNRHGKQLKVPPFTLKPGPTDFKLEDLTKGAEDFDSGNIEVMYQGNAMAVTAQVGVFLPNKRISFESREVDMMDFASSTAHSIVWLPWPGAKAYVALTNTSPTRLETNVSIAKQSKTISLSFRETQLLDLGAMAGAQSPTVDNGEAVTNNLEIAPSVRILVHRRRAYFA